MASSSGKRCRAARNSPAGDVILVHRLLKNEVGKRFGGAYALYSDACVRAVGIDPQAQAS